MLPPKEWIVLLARRGVLASLEFFSSHRLRAVCVHAGVTEGCFLRTPQACGDQTVSGQFVQLPHGARQVLHPVSRMLAPFSCRAFWALALP